MRDKILHNLKIIILSNFTVVLLVASAVITNYALFSSAQTPGGKGFNREAYEHFRNGLLFDLQGNSQEAIKELIRASQLDTSNAVIYKALGDIYVRKTQEYTLGAAVYEKYLEKNPFNDRTIDLVLQIYLRASQPPRLSRAESVLSKAISNGNDQPKYYAQLTDILLQQKKIELAQSMSIRFIRRTSDSQEACSQVAEMFKDNSMIVEGVDFFSNYLKDNPEAVNIGITVGRLHEAREDYEAAEKAYIDVLNKNEIAHIARFYLAQLYMRLGRIENALNLYEGIDFDDPEEVRVKLMISEQLFQRGADAPFAQIESIMESVKNKIGSNALVYFFLGRAQAAQDRHEEAVESFEEAVRNDPMNINALYFLAQSELELKKYDYAVKAINRAVKLAPNSPGLYVLQGIIYDQMDDFENAAAAYQAGLAINTPNNSARPTLLNNYSYLLSEHDKDLDKALKMVEEAIRAEPENSSFLDTIGWVHFKLGNLDEALINIRKSIEREPESAEVLDHLGDVYQKMGDLNKAKEYWQKALEHDKDNEKIKEKLRKK